MNNLRSFISPSESTLQKVEMTDLAMANVEALARGEGCGIPYRGAYANWDKGGCGESGRWSDECRSSSFCK